MSLKTLEPKVTEIVSNSNETTENRLLQICKLLEANIDYYNWVGFYFANHTTQTLHLGPYVGAPTDHTVIPFGKGICGQVAVSNTNFVVPDVAAQDNYIACSFTVKSEIVVPLFVNGENIGQIDIDSNTLDPFTTEDERFYEHSGIDVKRLLGAVVRLGASGGASTITQQLAKNLFHYDDGKRPNIVIRLTQKLKDKNLKIHIETSGAYPLSGTWDWICLSPKKNKLPTPTVYENANELKVIIHNKHDFIFAEEQAEKVNFNAILFLQPEWSKKEEMTPLIVDYVMNNPKWRVSLQTHKYLNIP